MALNLLENSFFKTLLYNSFKQLSSNVTGFYQHTSSKGDATMSSEKRISNSSCFLCSFPVVSLRSAEIMPGSHFPFLKILWRETICFNQHLDHDIYFKFFSGYRIYIYVLICFSQDFNCLTLCQVNLSTYPHTPVCKK